MVEPGRRNLGGRYELSELIAAGGMGQVWRGTDVLLGRPVAVKVLRSEYTGDPTFRARFRAEAQHAAALSHPNIAAVFDYGETEATDGSGETLAYLVMELVEGEPLSALLRREGRLDPATTLSLLEQAAAALAEAHRLGLVHRDVKPGNILVRPDGSVEITDFGIAWSAGSVPLTRTGHVIGTPQYLAPEVAEGSHAGPASDVYALGLVGYECLTGSPAFAGDNPVTVALKQVREDPPPLPDELPRGVRTLIRRALVKDPAARIPDGAAFAAVIDDVRAGRPLAEPAPTLTVPVRPGPPAGEPPAPRVSSPPAPRRRGLAAVLVPLATLLLGAGAAAGVFAAVSGDPESPTVVAARTDDAGIVLTAEDYVGRPVDEVALSLSALGLVVQRQEQVIPDAVPGLVTGVDPVGARLAAGDPVQVAFAVAPPASSTPGRAAATATGDSGRAASTTRPQPQQEARTTTPAPTAAPSTSAVAPAPPPPSVPPTPTAPATTQASPTTSEPSPTSEPEATTGSPTGTPPIPVPSVPVPSGPAGEEPHPPADGDRGWDRG
ncbi:serine/threonine protein kinase [Geodermatophilus sp. TF02-6]|uniref:serine/threonine protein kinase n=1 Tax=Geodermatophilus sp. TF02-6 TaxID=2250575 RepID=UPI000DEA1A6B|nr:serine/threonine protein kinase [Geodermatophilus sp. TF02-6]RBY80824.1 serine/threonine protein kinase [Geodermatophilus sp. TF02-6]